MSQKHADVIRFVNRAYEVLGDHPNRHIILFNIGQCHEMSFRYDDAMQSYRQFLEQGGENVEDRARVETHLQELERLLATVSISPSAATCA